MGILDSFSLKKYIEKDLLYLSFNLINNRLWFMALSVGILLGTIYSVMIFILSIKKSRFLRIISRSVYSVSFIVIMVLLLRSIYLLLIEETQDSLECVRENFMYVAYLISVIIITALANYSTLSRE